MLNYGSLHKPLCRLIAVLIMFVLFLTFEFFGENMVFDLQCMVWSSRGNWLDGCGLLWLWWCHVSDRLPRPHASKHVIREEMSLQDEVILMKDYEDTW